MRIFALILPIFYFSYWLIYKTKPFSLILFILIYGIIFLIEMIIAGIISGSSEVIEEKAIDIDEEIRSFDNRLKYIEGNFK